MNIHITQDDIDAAKNSDKNVSWARRCPIAQCLKRMYPDKSVLVTRQFVYLDLDEYQLDPTGVRFTLRADCYHLDSIKPVDFTMEKT